MANVIKLEAALRAALWAIIAAFGHHEAMKILEKIKAEAISAQWDSTDG